MTYADATRAATAAMDNDALCIDADAIFDALADDFDDDTMEVPALDTMEGEVAFLGASAYM